MRMVMTIKKHNRNHNHNNNNNNDTMIHYSNVIMVAMASHITILTIVYSTFYTGGIKEESKHRVTGLCAGNSPVAGEFPAQMASNAENDSIWRRHHEQRLWWRRWCWKKNVKEMAYM